VVAAVLIGNWWALALRGVAAIAFAIIAFAAPALTATVLIVIFGIYALIDGIFALLAAQRAAHRPGRSLPLLAEGVFDILVAVFALFFPSAALVVLVYVIAAWAIVSGIALGGAGVALLRLNGHLLMILGGALSIGLGVILLARPGAGIVVLTWWLGAYAAVFGIVMVAAAFRLREHYQAW
jgi:uncharacterized membrane protein HdeD (DUF308 family)